MKNKYFLPMSLPPFVVTVVNAKEFQVNADELWTEIVPESGGDIKPKCANGDNYSFNDN